MANPEGFTEASDDPTDGFRLSSFDEFRPDFTKWENSFHTERKKVPRSVPSRHLRVQPQITYDESKIYLLATHPLSRS